MYNYLPSNTERRPKQTDSPVPCLSYVTRRRFYTKPTTGGVLSQSLYIVRPFTCMSTLPKQRKTKLGRRSGLQQTTIRDMHLQTKRMVIRVVESSLKYSVVVTTKPQSILTDLIIHTFVSSFLCC